MNERKKSTEKTQDPGKPESTEMAILIFPQQETVLKSMEKVAKKSKGEGVYVQ